MKQTTAGYIERQDERRVVVFEREPFWEPELRRQFSEGCLSVRACRTDRDLDALTRQHENVVAVIDLSVDMADLLRWLCRQLADGRPIPTIAVADESQMLLEWRVRELGAVAVVDSFIGGRRLARLCLKQLAHPNIE